MSFNNQKEFLIPLISTSSADFYPENTLANHSVKLVKPLKLIGQYEVAVTEIILPYEYINVQDGEAFVEIYRIFKNDNQKKEIKFA